MLPALAMPQTRFGVPQNMGPTLNTPSNETSPNLTPSGLSLYFASDRAGGLGANDIYVSHRVTLNSAWGPPVNLGPVVNSANADVVGGFSLDGRSMLITCNRPGGVGLEDIYMSSRTDPNDDSGWTTPVNLGAIVNSTFRDIAPSFFEDPMTGAVSLIFSSDRIAMDGLSFLLFKSTRNENGTFGQPMAIDELNNNSAGSHFGAAIRRDGLEIYIGSARNGGLNFPGVDIWVSTRSATTAQWNTPALVAIINDLLEDRLPSLSPDASLLYFHSNRTGGSGGYDLYSASRCSLYGAGPCKTFTITLAPPGPDENGK